MPKLEIRYALFFLMLAAMGMVAGCGSIDRKPQNVQESLYVASVYGASLTRSVNDAYRSRTITKAQQLDALDNLQAAKDGVDAGLAAYAIGNFPEAQTGLDRAEAILRTVALLLAEFGDE